MKKYRKSFYLLFILSLSFFSFVHAAEEKTKKNEKKETPVIQGKQIDKIVALVNDSPMLKSELEENKKQLEIELTRSGQTEELDEPIAFEKKVLNQMIEDQLLEKEINRLGLEASDRAVEEVISEIMKQNNLPSKQALENALIQDGTTMEKFYENYKTRLSRNNFLEKMIRPRVKVDENEVKNAYKKRTQSNDQQFIYNISMIFKPSSSKNKKLLSSLQKKMEKKEQNFSELAKKHSEGPGKEEGGLLGDLRIENLENSLAQGVSQLEKGQISQVIENEKGLFLIQLNDKKIAQFDDYEKLKPAIEQELFNLGLVEQLNQYVQTLKQKSHIETFL
ncbi:MAG: SurA N-terminal domain-containing protein [Bdellovibrionales bacterium]|nr:SurA N-terminal domain-containing protein [Bdellovibrionales bacterium]